MKQRERKKKKKKLTNNIIRLWCVLEFSACLLHEAGGDGPAPGSVSSLGKCSPGGRQGGEGAEEGHLSQIGAGRPIREGLPLGA